MLRWCIARKSAGVERWMATACLSLQLTAPTILHAKASLWRRVAQNIPCYINQYTHTYLVSPCRCCSHHVSSSPCFWSTLSGPISPSCPRLPSRLLFTSVHQ